ncbi:DUF6799 domain-containing protein [Hymenobacter sp. BRD67]|uniref:DUF6799 domain-containing protein n=1 Tax=Hymenobacter sp. BRD67 TaxID=2675877 RepID=UPI001563C92A|nr:DUF6799 domain-containing protein [Hymenobacter sp. BRD67]QKG52126.1 hypothetical protein GKZ67_05280 [Hymenobacter sp. BRD67]
MNLFLKFAPALVVVCTISLAHAQTPVAQEEGHMPTKDKKMHSRGMEDYVMMRDGKMMRMQEGKAMPLTETMTMNNGTKVMTDGNVMMADGKSMMLHDGQRVMLDGKVQDMKMGQGKMKGKMSSM